nr:ribonuclease H-like domain-containing protein [Tanacetum cinerariifolium]
MGDVNHIRTLGDYSKPSHEGYRNTIELPEGNNVDPSPHARILLLVSLLNSFHREGLQNFAMTSLCSNNIKENLFLNGPHDTHYCMKNPEQAFVEYASSHTDEAGGSMSNFMASQDARLSKFEADFKHQQSEMTNKIDTVLKAITDRIAGALPSDTVKNPKLNVNSTTSVFLLVLTVQWIPNAHLPLPLQSTLSDHALRKNYQRCRCPHRKAETVKRFLRNQYKEGPRNPLLVGRGFLATANEFIDCRKAKITVGEGITRSVFEVKGIDLEEKEAPYWTTLAKRESYKP